MKANIYRSLSCGDLRENHIGQEVRIAGWVENIRDHGGVLFLDIRDQYGVTQVVIHDDKMLEGVNRECTVSISGKVVKRDEETINRKIARFQNERLTDVIEDLFVQLIMKLHKLGEIKFNNIFIDGTKIEANANRYTFVWAKTIEKNLQKLNAKINSGSINHHFLSRAVKGRLVQTGVIRDPAAGVDQPTALIVHLSGILDQTVIHIFGVKIQIDIGVCLLAGEVLQRGDELLEPDPRQRRFDGGVLRDSRYDVVGASGGGVGFALMLAPPSGVFLIIGHTDVSQIPLYAFRVAQ